MTALESALLLGLLLAVLLRRREIDALERRLAASREATREAAVVIRFSAGLAAIAAEAGESMPRKVVELLTDCLASTSGALFKVGSDGALGRIEVCGSHPAQSPAEMTPATRAARIAASMGPESVGVGNGLVGSAARDARTCSSKRSGERPAEVAIPLLNDGRLFGVLAFAGPLSGAAFAPSTIALGERLSAAATPLLARM